MTVVCGDILDQTGAYVLDEAGTFIWDELGPCDHSVATTGGAGIASSTKRKPAVYVDGFRRVRKELASQQVEVPAPEVKPETVAPQPAAPFVPLLLNKLIADQPANPADELRAREIARQLKLMRDDDEAIALLLLN